MTEFFFCKRASCQLRVKVCLDRQALNDKKPTFPPFPTCLKCSQGEANRKLEEAGGLMEKEKDSSASAEIPKITEIQGAKIDDVRLCACGKPTMSPSCPFCGTCMAKRSAEAIARKKMMSKESPPEAPPKRPRGRPKNPQKAIESPSTFSLKPASVVSTVTIQFGEYLPILEEIKKVAREELRPVEMQIIYMLKRSLGMDFKERLKEPSKSP